MPSEIASSLPRQSGIARPYGTVQGRSGGLGDGGSDRAGGGVRRNSHASAPLKVVFCEAEHSVRRQRCESVATEYVDGHHACWVHRAKYQRGGAVRWLRPRGPLRILQPLPPNNQRRVVRAPLPAKPEGMGWEEFCESRWATIEAQVLTVGGRAPEPY